jgi:tRNA modification GTPase
MSLKLSMHSDTIVAPVTAPGTAAIGVVRLSGSRALAIADALFVSKKLSEQASHTLHVGWLAIDGNLIDEAVVSIYRNPKSYTGEDVVEISCHGSPLVLNKVLEACMTKGARLAGPGEFTQRAFLNGKMDLTQAESVADMIASQTDAQQQSALHQLRGGFRHDLQWMREKLVEFSALMELELDFAEEDVEFADRLQFRKLLDDSLEKVRGLIDSFRLGNVVANGVRVAIVGRPNAGKSTLLNTLLNEERALVSAIAGTTRDTVEESINIGGILFHFIDTAGIRSHTTDEIEEMGIRRSHQKIAQADIVLLLTEPGDEGNLEAMRELVGDKKHLVVVNKIDAHPETERREGYLYVSAREKSGIGLLTGALHEMAAATDFQSSSTLITNTRHLQHLRQIETHLQAICSGMEQGLTSDLLAPDIKLCLQHIGELTGTVTNENVLDYVFSKFCIGK